MKKKTAIARASDQQTSKYANIFDLIYPGSKAFDRLIPINAIRSMKRDGWNIEFQNLDMTPGEEP